MENASKALVMAGSIFLSLMIVGALIFMFNSLSNFKQTEEDMEDVSKLAQYNKQIESFNKTYLYGSEILSLVNYIEDYNVREEDTETYEKITIKITLKKIVGAKYIKATTYTNPKELIKDFNNLEKANNTLKKKEFCGRTIEEYYGMKSQEIYNIVETYKITKKQSYDIDKKVEEINKKVAEYSALRSELTTFKLKVFKNNIKAIKYEGSRITYMEFAE